MRTIDWKSPITADAGEQQQPTNYLYFTGAHYNVTQNNLPVYSESIRLGVGYTQVNVSLLNPVYEPLTSAEEALIKEGTTIPTTISVDAQVAEQKKVAYAQISLLPFRSNKATGKVEKLVSFSLSVMPKKSGRSGGAPKSYVTNSVLGSGDWYKLGVMEDGIYQLTYNYLSNLGINLSSLSASSIDIYGNGVGLLPEDNSAYRPDDLLENAIHVEDVNNNGVFEQGDYVLFYAKGPHRWEYDSVAQSFEHVNHPYSDTSYYFLTIGQGAGKRIGTQNQSGTANTTVTTFNDYAFHENNLTNLVKSGREWYGEYFDITTTYQYAFSFPQMVTTSPATLVTNVIARTAGTSNSSSFDLMVNNGLATGSFSVMGVSNNYTGDEGRPASNTLTFNPDNSGSLNIGVTFDKFSSTSVGWMNYLEANVRRNLFMSESQLDFRDAASVGIGNVSEFIISNAGNVQEVWEITDASNITRINTTPVGNELHFTLPTESLREFVAFDGNAFNTPLSFGKVTNQDLHGLPQTDMVIVVHPNFVTEAVTLANHRRNDGVSVEVVTPYQVYNEFSSGMQDPTAIKEFLRMFYKRAGTDTTLMPKYLLLFGDGSYDNKYRIPGNTNYVVTFQSRNSYSYTQSYVTDDYFGLLDDAESSGLLDLVDVGIGRFPVRTKEEAASMVNKVIRYETTTGTVTSGHCYSEDNNSVLGDWRNIVCLIADDEDNNTHLSQAEQHANNMVNNYPMLNLEKVYMDAYKQESTPGGERYPDAAEALKSRVEKGALIINYIGHGGEVGWAHERVLDLPTIQNWGNSNRLPLFVTATCEFSRFDDPARTSAGEYVFLNQFGGGIALLTTTRLVYSGPNYNLNRNFYSYAFTRPNGELMRLGDVNRLTKNLSVDPFSSNHRNFTLLGDPSMKLAVPEYNVVTTEINNTPVGGTPDTLRALSTVTITGYVEDNNGQKMTSFNGVLTPTIFDKNSSITTLANDGGADVTFNLRKNVLYKGKVTVTNGDFSFSFVVPKDIAYQYGVGKISYYAEDGSTDANGYSRDIIVGGSDTTVVNDSKGPDIDLFLNDENFVFGGMTDENPTLIANVFDDNGINTVGNGIGHDITAILDANTDQEIVLNDYYESDLNTYKSGAVRYPFSEIAEGAHTLTFKIWDVYNNSAEATTEFIVAHSEQLVLSHLLNYPNPFTTKTSFFFEHNQVCSNLEVQIQVFTVSGKLVKTISEIVNTDGFKVDPIDWNGRDDFGDKLGRGVYVYKLKVRSPDGEAVEKFEKLVILN